MDNKTSTKKIVAAGGTSVFALVFIMMLIYIVFEGKIPSSLNLPISFPILNSTETVQRNSVSFPSAPSSYAISAASYPQITPTSYP